MVIRRTMSKHLSNKYILSSRSQIQILGTGGFSNEQDRQKLAPILGTYHEKNKQIKKYQIKIGACRDLKRMMGRA